MFSFVDDTLVLQIVKAIAVGIALVLSSFLFKRGLKWVFDKFNLLNDKKEKTIETFLLSAINYLSVILYLVYLLIPHFDIPRILAGAGVIGLLLAVTLQKLVKDVFIGIIRLNEKQITVGDYVMVNGLHKGTIEETRIRFVKIREWSGRLVTLSHSQIYEIHNYNKGYLNVIEHIIISQREDPEKAKRIIEDVCQKMNDRLKEWLHQNDEGTPTQPFEFYGITALNTDYFGLKVTVVGSVKPEHYFESANAIRFELAKVMYSCLSLPEMCRSVMK